jgi:hypothetical protein
MKVIAQRTRRDGKVALTLLFSNGVTLRKVVSPAEAQRLQLKALEDGRAGKAVAP